MRKSKKSELKIDREDGDEHENERGGAFEEKNIVGRECRRTY